MQYWLMWPGCLQLPQVGTFEDFVLDVRAVGAMSDVVDDLSAAAWRVCSLSR